MAFQAIFRLDGKVCVVTGGTGILGRVYCHALAEFGAAVAVVDVNEAACAQLAEQLRTQWRVPALGVAADISQPGAVAELVAKIENDLGPISILLNNAASKGSDPASFMEAPESFRLETWREVMAVNLDGLFLMAQEVGRSMLARGAGSIINVASIYGVVGPDPKIYVGSEYNGLPICTPPVYSASKAGVIGLTRYLAAMWGSRGIRVNCLTPGGVESGQNHEFLRRYGERTPLGRMAKPGEMVGAVIYLASDASSYVNGHNLIVDGGWTIW